MKNLSKSLLLGALALAVGTIGFADSAAAAGRQVKVVRSIGTGPVNECGSAENQWKGSVRAAGLLPQQEAELKKMITEGRGENTVVKNGELLDIYLGCSKGRVVDVVRGHQGIKLDVPYVVTSKTFKLSDGRVIEIIDKCGNWIVRARREIPPPPPPPAPPPEKPQPPAPPPPEQPPLPPAPPVVLKDNGGLCDKGRINAVIGAEIEPTINGSNSRSLYGAAGIYCMRRVSDGQIGFGIGGQAAFYGGDVRGVGKFDGHLYGVGPAVMRVWNKGQDLEVKAMVMSYGSNYREGGYRFGESRTVLGVSAAFNDYRGRIDGTGRPETQYFALCGVPVGGKSNEYWQGQRVVNGSQLGLICNAGVRKYLTEGKAWNPYVQVGLLGEARKGGADFLTGSLRLGASNRARTIGCGAGINFNILEGGIHPGLGCWADLAGMVRNGRTKKRAAAITVDTGTQFAETATIAPQGNLKRDD